MNKAKGSLWMVAASFAGNFAQLIAARFYLQWLGDERFGTVVYCLAFAVFAMLVDLGYARVAQLNIAAIDPLRGQSEIDRLCSMVASLTALSVTGSTAIVLIAGQFVPLPSGPLSAEGRLSLFLPVAMQAGVSLAYNALPSLLLAHDKFVLVAASNLFRLIMMAAAGLIACNIYRTPESVLWGMAIGVASAAALTSLAVVRQLGHGIFRPRWDAGLAKQFFSFGIRSHAQRMSAVLSGGIDRLMIAPIIGGANLTWYAYAARVPEFLSDSLSPIYTSTLSELSRRQAEGQEAFRATLQRNVLLLSSAAALLVAIPSACAHGFLLIILGKSAPSVPVVAVCFGLYKGFELVFNGYFMGLLAKDKQERMSLPYLANAALTIVLCVPISRQFGIVGVAVMNMGIQVCCFGITLLIARRSLFDNRPLWRHGLHVGLIMAGSTAAAWGLTILFVPVTSTYPLLSLVLAPLSAAAGAFILFGARLAPFPETFVRGFRRLTGRNPSTPLPNDHDREPGA